MDVDPELMENLQYAANLFFVWIGFGTVVGLLAKAIMPGRDPGGAIATMAMGVVGTVIGCGIVSFFFEGHAITPISPTGFAIGTAGAFIILFFYRLLAGYWFVEGEHPRPRLRRSYRRRRSYSYLDD
ncbi:MAG: GlsB/YeaQ/YmgE family stress response membrane protein [Pirellulaceae bacterium]|nr:GlsB/YeaQ/YmgE family stress response membrane protein [Pirellulaceae bacterium]